MHLGFWVLRGCRLSDLRDLRFSGLLTLKVGFQCGLEGFLDGFRKELTQEAR